jgi:hypothetical protein
VIRGNDHLTAIRRRERAPSTTSIATERSAEKKRYSITSSARPEKWRRNGDAERFGGLEIDVKLDFGYLLDR